MTCTIRKIPVCSHKIVCVNINSSSTGWQQISNNWRLDRHCSSRDTVEDFIKIVHAETLPKWNLFEFSPRIYLLCLCSRQISPAFLDWTRFSLNLQSISFNFSSFLTSEHSLLASTQYFYLSVVVWKIIIWAPNFVARKFISSASKNIQFSLKLFTDERLPNPKELKLSNYNFLSHHLLLQDHFSTETFSSYFTWWQITKLQHYTISFDCELPICG